MEEKMLILKMLQEGKITTDEAVKLLEALEKTTPNSNPTGAKINDFRDELTAKLNDMKLDEKLNKIGEKATKLAETIGEKAGKLAGQLGENMSSEKFSNNTEKFTEEFSKRMESLGQDIAESAAKFADTFASQFGSMFEAGYEKYRYNSSYTYPAAEAASIYLRTNNFSIKANPNENNEIALNLYVNSNMPQIVVDDYFKAVIDGNTYKFSSEFPGRTWGKIELLLPKGMEILNVGTDNAKCELTGLEAGIINCSTSNGKVVITGCKASEMEILTDNEKVVLDGVSARTANIRTSNSKISIDSSSLDNIDARTSNAPISVAVARKGDSLSSSYTLNTSNGKIEIGLENAEGFEHMVDAHTTMGSIDISLPNLTYSMDRKNIGMQSTAQVKSDSFDASSNKIAVKANTSNAQIRVGSVR